jgi:hypothetical protein
LSIQLSTRSAVPSHGKTQYQNPKPDEKGKVVGYLKIRRKPSSPSQCMNANIIVCTSVEPLVLCLSMKVFFFGTPCSPFNAVVQFPKSPRKYADETGNFVVI